MTDTAGTRASDDCPRCKAPVSGVDEFACGSSFNGRIGPHCLDRVLGCPKCGADWDEVQRPVGIGFVCASWVGPPGMHDHHGPDCLNKQIEKLTSYLEAGQWSDCPEHGILAKIDEDGCCVMCGKDAMVYARRADHEPPSGALLRMALGTPRQAEKFISERETRDRQAYNRLFGLLMDEKAWAERNKKAYDRCFDQLLENADIGATARAEMGELRQLVSDIATEAKAPANIPQMLGLDYFTHCRSAIARIEDLLLQYEARSK